MIRTSISIFVSYLFKNRFSFKDLETTQTERELDISVSKLSKPITGKLQIPPSKLNYAEQMLADSRVLRIILRQIAQEANFLLEVKLMNLLKPYISEDNQNIIEIDNVFKVS